jgi:hypothetical protein
VSQRRAELKAALVLLEPKVEAEELAVWLSDVEHDAAQRQARLGEMALPSSSLFSTMEDQAVEQCVDMFRLFEGSSESTRPSLTKYDATTRRLYGRAKAEIRADPQDVVAYLLNFDSNHMKSSNAANFRIVRSDTLEKVNAHHTIVFLRYMLPGLSDRTFVMSFVAKQLAKHPLTYAVALVPIPGHAKIGRKDEVGAIRAENCRGLKLTAVAPGVSKLEYCCSLDLRGRVPQLVTDKVATPAQMKVTAATALARRLSMPVHSYACAR